MSQDKIQNRIMGEYSIAKSFKGILRIAHIVDLIQGEPDIFLNPAYYGTPNFKLDISGKSNSSRQIGTQSAVHSLKGSGVSSLSISRYEFPQDELRNRRVPMTDSLGNYLNWNVGHDGVTIGSNDMISDNSLVYNVFEQEGYKNYPIYQEKFFPVYNTNTVIIGRINKEHRSDNKSSMNQGLLYLEQGGRKPKLIIENLYEKSPDALQYQEVYKINPQSGKLSAETVRIAKYKPHTEVMSGNRPKYKKIRTIYNDTKPTVQDYDVLMYQQNDWDYNNYKAIVDGDDTFTITTDLEPYDNSATYNNKFESYKQGDLLDCNVDFVNIRDYLQRSIEKYLNSTIVEVPSGTVIWQYCSLDKWRSYNDTGDVDEGSYPGNRPALETRNPQDNPFYSSIIQGVCKKINKLKRNGQAIPVFDENSSLSLDASGSYLDEIIPLYKRDYVLCDGSRFRLPFYPQKMSNNFAKHRTSFDRFFNLFFTIGYTYTDREKMFPRARYKKCTAFTDDTLKVSFNPAKDLPEINDKLLVVNKNDKFIVPSIWYSKLKETYGANFTTKYFGKLENVAINVKNFNELNDTESHGWSGEGALKMEYVYSNPAFDNCTSSNPLFDEDLATMLAVNAIYTVFKKHHDETNKYLDYATLLNTLKELKIQEKHIFNSFTDTNEGIRLPFRYVKETDKEGNKIYSDVSVNIGKEVNNFSSEISFFNTETRKLEKRAIYELPMVNFILMLLSSEQCDDGYLFKYFYSFFCYDFCVPTMLPEDDTPSFLGSGGYIESDEFANNVRKPFIWKTKFTHSTLPHRHGVFAGKSILNDNSVEKEVSGTQSQNYSKNGKAKYKPSELPGHYKLGEVTTTSTAPIGIAGYWGGDIHPFNKYSSRAYSLKWQDDENDNYIINQHHSKTETVDVYGMKVNVLTNTGYYMENVELGADPDEETDDDELEDDEKQMTKYQKIKAARRYSWATGGNRELTGTEIQILNFKKVKNTYKNYKSLADRLKIITKANENDIVMDGSSPEVVSTIKFKQTVKYEGTKKLGDSSNYNLDNRSDMQEYYHYQKDAWYGLLPYEDQRFDNSEPNRGLSSEPIPFTGSIKLFYKKLEENFAYGSDKNSNGKQGFFSPEHITMLPLIKL